jgi:hypothetical protein
VSVAWQIDAYRIAEPGAQHVGRDVEVGLRKLESSWNLDRKVRLTAGRRQASSQHLARGHPYLVDIGRRRSVVLLNQADRKRLDGDGQVIEPDGAREVPRRAGHHALLDPDGALNHVERCADAELGSPWETVDPLVDVLEQLAERDVDVGSGLGEVLELTDANPPSLVSLDCTTPLV